jgi:dTDP-4-dehydrorhamnose 3,5-epimerase
MLSRENRAALFVPAGFAHGFQTLEDDTEVLYAMSAEYVPDAARGGRWDDPAFQVKWPLPVSVISDRDRRFPDWAAKAP